MRRKIVTSTGPREDRDARRTSPVRHLQIVDRIPDHRNRLRAQTNCMAEPQHHAGSRLCAMTAVRATDEVEQVEHVEEVAV